MRVTDVSLHTENQEVLCFGLRKTSPSDKYLIKTMIGLDADEIVPKFQGFGLNTGKSFFRMALNKREIVMRIQLNPRFALAESYSSVRDDLYRAISASRTGELTLYFKDGAAVVASLKCHIKKFEVPHFSNIPEIQITMDSEDYFLRGANYISVNPASLWNGDKIEFTDVQSTAPHGFRIKFGFSNAITEFVMSDAAVPDWQFKVNTPFAATDILEIDSDSSGRSVTFTQFGITTEIANHLEPGSLWPIIYPGFNEFYVADSGSVTILEMEYKTSYWGI